MSEEAGPQKVRAWGPGLEIGMVGRSADFVVEAIGTEVGTLGMSRLGVGPDHVTCVSAGSQILLGAVKGNFFWLQVSPSRVHLKPRLSVMIKATGHVMFGTGPLNRATTLSTSSVMMRTSRTAPSWHMSSRQPVTPSRRT